MTEPVDQRILRAAVEALKARQRLPRRDARHAANSWLRPNFPFALIASTHRQRVVDMLVAHADLRAEVRLLLSAGIDLLAVDPVASESLSDQLDRSDRPDLLLEAASTHPDDLVAAAAAPFLTGELSLPERPSQPKALAASAPAPAEDPSGLRRQLREAGARERELSGQVRASQAAVLRLESDLTSAQAAVAAERTRVAELKRQLPTRKQLRAVEQATDLAMQLRRAKRDLTKASSARGEELQSLRQERVELNHAFDALRREFDIERASRRRLEQGLGSVEDRARRLAILVEREIADLVARIAAERPGRERSRLQKRSDALRVLLTSLADLYDLDPASPSTLLPAAEPPPAVVLASDRGLRVTPLGGNNHIGGSALLVEAAGTRILVDAGLRPGAHLSRPGPKLIDEAIRGRLDAIIITHAHADHAGYVPWVVERQRRAKVICTPQTKSLLPTVWADSVRVMRAEADRPTHGGESVEPPYGEAEVSQAEDLLQALPCGQTLQVKDVRVSLFDAGHILGAAGVVMEVGDRRVVITGDIDDRAQASVGPALIPPRLARNADLLVIETTYCDAIHPDRTQEGADLVKAANDVLAVGGRILIPAFGLGRAQEIALLVGAQLPNVDVRVDGLAATISELYAQNHAPNVLQGRIRKVNSAERRREILGFRNGIVITTSGMLTGGAAVPWAQAVLTEPQSALFLCGHQDEEAPGRELEDLAGADPEAPRVIRLRDADGRYQTINVAAAVIRYNLSAHADRLGLRRIIEEITPRAIMLVHGDPGPQEAFRGQLEGSGYRVVDNREAWDSEASIPDPRRPRQRRSVTSSRRGSSRA